MFDQTVTVYHRIDAGQRDRWIPILLKNAYFRKAAGINAGSQSEAKSLESTLIVRAADWNENIAGGDYVVPGQCEQTEFVGSAAAILIPLGGLKIESVSDNSYANDMGNYLVMLR
ncbi:MAG: hypothetical protein LUE11_12955 [Clostridia bacterium]|nr:hypothetical protein [Clostridia bacterium]